MLNFKFSEAIKLEFEDERASITFVEVEVRPGHWERLFQVTDADFGVLVQPLYFVPGGKPIKVWQEDFGVIVARVPKPDVTDEELSFLDEDIEQAYAESCNGDSAEGAN